MPVLSKQTRDRDSLSEVLKSYKLPILIIAIGMVLSIAGFLTALKYDITESERGFQSLSDQMYRNFETEMNRNRRQVELLARILSELEDLSEQEFLDITSSFSSITRFSKVNLYQVVDILYNETPDVEGEDFLIKKYFSRTPYEENSDSLVQAPELISAIENAATLKGKYISRPYEVTSDGVVKTYVAVVVPLSDKRIRHAFLVAVLDLKGLFDNTLKEGNHNLDVRVYSVDHNKNKPDEVVRKQMYQYLQGQNSQVLDVPFEDPVFQSLFSRKDYYLDDYFWRIYFTSSLDGYNNYVGLFPWIAFSSILVITFLLGFLTFQITAEQVRTQRTVMQQTKHLYDYSKRLEASNRDLDDFAYIASHDLKEPLRGIYNYAEFMAEDYGDKLGPEADKKLETMKKLARRMEKLVESLHDYSRLSRVDLTYEKVNIRSIIDDVLDTMKIWIQENKANVIVSEDLPEINCDPVRTAEVFRNLITNAIKYNDKAVKTVEIGCLYDEPHHPNIPVFYVRDNGIGVPKEHTSSIFKIFKRLHGRDEFGGGTGSGLTIVAKIVERHGGHIWVKSKVDEGTTFLFTLTQSRVKR